MKAWITLGLALASGGAVAGWFGPDNYEECVLENMKGVTSNTAAAAIAKACDAKFPKPPPPPLTAEELAKANEKYKQCLESADQLEAERNRKIYAAEQKVSRKRREYQSADQNNLFVIMHELMDAEQELLEEKHRPRACHQLKGI